MTESPLTKTLFAITGEFNRNSSELSDRDPQDKRTEQRSTPQKLDNSLDIIIVFSVT